MTLSKPRWTSLAAVAAVAVILAIGGTALAQSGGDTYTGCLDEDGDISNVAIGTVPVEPCGDEDEDDDGATQISWNAEGAPGLGLPSDCDAGDLAQWSGTEWECVDLETRISDLESAVADLEALLAAVSYDGTTVTVTGNLQVVNGTGTTGGAPNGEGNVIIGYNTDNSDDKSGSHYLVVGDDHTYTQHAGIVVGFDNTVTGGLASVAGGQGNTASGTRSFVAGGIGNTASGSESIVGAGNNNVASGIRSFVAGGFSNTATGALASVAGGESNTASGPRSFVAGGFFDTAGPGTCAFIADVNVVAC